jgi:gamma-glutamyltranspeptidase/glutathione hydrolase
LRASDLASFEVRWEDPVTWTDRHGRTICKAGPWTQGPMLLQQLALMEAGGWDALAPLDPEVLHATIETFKLAFADREGYFGDPRFVDSHLDALLSDPYLKERASLVDPSVAGDPGPGRPVDGVEPWSYALTGARGKAGDTTHLDLADGEGNLVAFTPSGGWFASPVIPELGFPLGTRCQTFWLDPSHPNRLEPGKRPRTTLTPTIVLDGDRPRYALGTPGGDNQDQVQSQMLHAMAHGRSPEEAVALPTVATMHPPSSFAPHGRELQCVSHEERLDGSVLSALAERGHRMLSAGRWGHGRPHVIEIEADGSIRAAVSSGLGGTGAVRTR